MEGETVSVVSLRPLESRGSQHHHIKRWDRASPFPLSFPPSLLPTGVWRPGSHDPRGATHAAPPSRLPCTRPSRSVGTARSPGAPRWPWRPSAGTAAGAREGGREGGRKGGREGGRGMGGRILRLPFHDKSCT